MWVFSFYGDNDLTTYTYIYISALTVNVLVRICSASLFNDVCLCIYSSFLRLVVWRENVKRKMKDVTFYKVYMFYFLFNYKKMKSVW